MPELALLVGIGARETASTCDSPKPKTAGYNSESKAMMAAGSDFTPSRRNYPDATLTASPKSSQLGRHSSAPSETEGILRDSPFDYAARSYR